MLTLQFSGINTIDFTHTLVAIEKMKQSTNIGAEFESKFLDYLKTVFKRLRYNTIEFKRQKGGTQFGFDIRVSFTDNNSKHRTFVFECKNYNTELDWSKIRVKLDDLEDSHHEIDGYFLISPKKDISNATGKWGRTKPTS